MAGRRRRGTPPPYLRHKASGQAYCTIGGKPVYLGPHGTPGSRKRYRRVIAQWEKTQGAEENRKLLSSVTGRGCLVAELADRFTLWARGYYRDEEGNPTSEVVAIEVACRLLVKEFGAEEVDDFRSKEIRELGKIWAKEGLRQRTINAYLSRIRRVFRWGVREGLVDAATLTALEAEPGVVAGRDPGVKAHKEIPPADDATVDLTLPFLSGPIRAMVQVQRLIGMRPGEVCRLKGKEIDRDGVVILGKGRSIKLPDGVWVFQPWKFKTRYRGKFLAYLIGPKAQEALTPYLRDDPEAYVFQPIEARTKKPAQGKLLTWVHEHYRPASYTAAIDSGIKRLNKARAAKSLPAVVAWSPNQLRHSVLTRYDQLAGIEISSIIAGHSTVATTEIYVERDLKRAAEVVKEHG
jgi:integrase